MAILNVHCEITGKVWKIEAAVGDQLEEGDTILIIESMKMEIPLQTSVAGVIAEMLVAEGDAVTEGDAVVAMEI